MKDHSFYLTHSDFILLNNPKTYYTQGG